MWNKFVWSTSWLLNQVKEKSLPLNRWHTRNYSCCLRYPIQVCRSTFISDVTKEPNQPTLSTLFISINWMICINTIYDETSSLLPGWILTDRFVPLGSATGCWPVASYMRMTRSNNAQTAVEPVIESKGLFHLTFRVKVHYFSLI